LRQRLGSVVEEGDWVTREELQAARVAAEEARASLARWESKLLDLRKNIEHTSLAPRQYAVEQLLSITDPDVIPALEQTFSEHSPAVGILGVRLLFQMREQEASLSLARHDVLCSLDPVREAANAALRNRPVDHYVPIMLAAMHSPIQSRSQVV